MKKTYYVDQNGHLISVKEGAIKSTYSFYRNKKGALHERGNRVKTRPMQFYPSKEKAEAALAAHAKKSNWRVATTEDLIEKQPSGRKAADTLLQKYNKHMPLFVFYKVDQPLWVNADPGLCLRFVNYLSEMLSGEEYKTLSSAEIMSHVCDLTFTLAGAARNNEGPFSWQEVEALRKKFLFNEVIMKQRTYEEGFCGDYNFHKNSNPMDCTNSKTRGVK